MLRLTWRLAGGPPKLFTDDEFINEVRQMAARDFVGAPEGPVLVEALDERSGVSWRGYYERAAGLVVLLQQLVAEGEIAARSRLGSSAAHGPDGAR